QHLTWRVRHVIVAAQHEVDTHERIVERIRKKERHAAVGAADDEIADVVRVEALLSMHEVVEDDDFARWNAKTQRCRLTALQALSALRIAEHPTRPRIPRRFACRQLLLARNAQLRRR